MAVGMLPKGFLKYWRIKHLGWSHLTHFAN